MKLTALSIALVAAVGLTTGCSTQTTYNQSTVTTAADAQAQYALGRFYQGQERYEQAIQAYRQALAANPAHVSAHNGLGASLLLSGRTAEAIEQFKSGLKHQPRSAALWNNLGYAYALSGEPKLAEMAYKQSLDLDPTDYKTNTNLAMIQQATPDVTPATVMAAQAPEQTQPALTAAVEIKSIPVYPAQPSATKAPLAKDMPAPDIFSAANKAQASVSSPKTEPATLTPAVTVQAATVKAVNAQAPIQASTPSINTLPANLALDRALDVAPAKAVPIESAAKQQPVIEVAETPVMPPSVQIAKVAPQVYEVNLPDPSINTASASKLVPVSAPVAGTKRISVPLREDVAQIASVDSGEFTLEIRNGNGVRHMAFQTSQHLAGHGYQTNYLTNQPGFNVKVTQVLYLPGYLEEAKRLLAHLPKDTVLTETDNLRQGTQVRVVLGHDMAQQQAEEKAPQIASSNSDDFVLEIRNGNGVRHLAFRTSQYLAGHGYNTHRLTNQRGFNVKVTQVLYLPGYLEEAQRLLAHLPKDTLLTETTNLRRGTHVRVVLGKDMVERQAT